MDPLREALAQLARALQRHDVPLIVGGGYGLVLRLEHVRARGLRTLREYPSARATEDLDLFLSAEVIVDAGKMGALRDTLAELGYTVVTGREHYQFVRPVAVGIRQRSLKVDLLAQRPLDTSRVKIKDRRIRPHGFNGLHAHVTPEALTVHRFPLAVELLDGGEPVMVYVPHPFSYLVLKLFAFRDRADHPKGAYHAFDLYGTVAAMTRDEWEQGGRLRQECRHADPFPVAQSIVREMFSGPDGRGVLRMREHAAVVGFPLTAEMAGEFCADLRELLLGPEG